MYQTKWESAFMLYSMLVSCEYGKHGATYIISDFCLKYKSQSSV